jgi:hypothetical protein
MSTRRPSKRPKAISDENSNEAPSSSLCNLPVERDPDNCVATPAVTGTRQKLPMEVVSQILSEFITEDVMSNRDSCGKGSRLREWRRRDICSILLTSREVHKEASRLMHERLNLTVYIEGDRGATRFMYHLRRAGYPGPWNRFRKIKICLHPQERTSGAQCVPNVIDALKEAWKLLHSHLRTKDKGCWQQIELSCNADMSYWDVRSLCSKPYWWGPGYRIRPRKLRQLNGTLTLRFNANLRLLREADLQS